MERRKPQLSELPVERLIDSLSSIITAIDEGTTGGILIAEYRYPMVKILEALADVERERGLCIYDTRTNAWLREVFGENDWPYDISRPGTLTTCLTASLCDKVAR
jgi:hypothetical protein